MERVTGAPATMWGPSMVGFGSRPYTNTMGTNDWPIVGFSPRKQALTIYGVYDGYGPHDPLLDDLGPHTTGKGCLYVKRLGDVDEGVLEQMIRNAWERAKDVALTVSSGVSDRSRGPSPQGADHRERDDADDRPLAAAPGTVRGAQA